VLRRGLLAAVVLTLVAVAGASGDLVPQGAKLTGAGEIGQGRFGVSVALSADGRTLLVGGNTDNNNTTFGVGAAWVFTRSGGTWTQQGPKLTASDGVNLPAFGYDVALSGDGNTALIGGPGDKGNVGAVWTFTRSNGVWTQQGAKLTAAGATGPGHFGETVALSADGATAVVGAPNEGSGVMRVYTRSGASWAQQGAPLVASDGVDFVFLGQNLALAADGNTFITSGENENQAVGAAWVFTRMNGVWAQQGPKLTVATTGSFPRFGAGLALTADGNFALIGASREAGTGAIWQFARSGGMWSQQGGRLTAGDASAGAGFGGEIALSRDGTTALVAGSGEGSRGAVWTFTRNGSTYQQRGSKLVPPDLVGSNTAFGAGVALSAYGTTAVVSAPADSTARGAAWTYVVPEAETAPGAPTGVAATPGDGQATVSFAPPGSEGGAAVGVYTVTASPGGLSASGTASPVTVFGLDNGTSYTFTVTATNEFGTGPASSSTDAVVPEGDPRPHSDPPPAVPRPDTPAPASALTTRPPPPHR